MYFLNPFYSSSLITWSGTLCDCRAHDSWTCFIQWSSPYIVKWISDWTITWSKCACVKHFESDDIIIFNNRLQEPCTVLLYCSVKHAWIIRIWKIRLGFWIYVCIWYVVEPNYGFYTTGRESADGGLYWHWFLRAVLNASKEFACMTLFGRWFQWITVSTKKECWYCCFL